MEKFRILQVVNSLVSAGAEKLVVDTSLKFVEEGHKVDILVLKTVESPLSDLIAKNNDIELFSLGKENNMYNPLCILKVAKHLKKNKYNVIHAHLFPPFYWVALAKYSNKEAIFIHTEHNTNNRRMNKAYLRLIENFIYKKYDYHIAISNTVRNNMDKHIIANKKVKIRTIFNGVNLKTISEAQPYIKSELGLEEACNLIIQVSAFRPQKNQETLIRALQEVSNTHLILVGDGERRAECQQLANDLGLKDNVHFLGIRDDVPRLLKTADIVVLSSHYEGLSLSSVEGMASGKPFVAADVPGLTEVVKDAGILFENNNHQQLSEILKELITNTTLYKKTVEDCLARSKAYDLNKMSTEYLALYAEVIASEQKIKSSNS